jgi:hypothetical protein
MNFTRRNFCAVTGGALALLALGSACRQTGGYDITFREFDGDHEIPADVAREGLAFVSKAR